MNIRRRGHVPLIAALAAFTFPVLTAGTAQAATGTLTFTSGHAAISNPENGQCYDIKGSATYGPQGVTNNTDTNLAVYITPDCSGEPIGNAEAGGSYVFSSTWYPALGNIGSVKAG